MPRLRRAFELSASDWWVILQAAFWFAVVEFGLRVFEFRALVDLLHQESSLDHRVSRRQSKGAQRAAYCVELVSRLYPLNPTCLKKALVLYALLTRRGLDVQVFIGAAKTDTDKGRELNCHAWLEHQGHVILGGQGHESYAPLCSLDRFKRLAHREGQVAS